MGFERFIGVLLSVLIAGTLLSIFAPDPGAHEYFIYSVAVAHGAIVALLVKK